MNVYSRTTRDLAKALTGQPIRPGYAALRDVIDIYDNDDATSREIAEQAMNDGRPAFWSMCSYHDQVSCNFLNSVNSMHSFDAAVEMVPAHQREMERLLGKLVPLNEAAVTELSNAYARHTATWRDPFELERRRVRDCRKAVA